MKKDDMVLVARIGVAHGIRGLVKVQSFTSNPEDFADYAPLMDENGKTIEMHITGEAKGQFLVQIKGVSTRNEAETYKGMNIYANREILGDLKDGEFFLNDLVDLHIADGDGNVYGTVTKVLNYGSCDLLEVKTDGKKSFLVPLTEDKVELVDFDNNRIIVKDIKELMELGGIKDEG